MTAILFLALLQQDTLREARQALARNDHVAARQLIQERLRRSPNDGAARFLSGFLYYLDNEHPNAVKELEAAAKLNEKDPRARLYLALSLESLGRSKEAENAYREAMRLESAAAQPDAETFLAFARFLLMEGRTDECEKHINRALEIAPNSRDAHYEMARLQLRLNQPSQALRSAERALALPAEGIGEQQIRYVLERARRAAQAK